MANYQICQILNMNVTGRSNNIATLERVNCKLHSELTAGQGNKYRGSFGISWCTSRLSSNFAVCFVTFMSARCSITYFRYLHWVWHNGHYCLAVKLWSLGKVWTWRHEQRWHHASQIFILVLLTINRRSCTITEKAPTRAFSWLKAATTTFTFKTLLRI